MSVNFRLMGPIEQRICLVEGLKYESKKVPIFLQLIHLLMQLADKFRYLDLFGQPFSILVDHSKLHKTILGALFSCAIMAIVMYSFVTSVNQSIQGTSPKVTTYKSPLPPQEKYLFGKNEFLLAIQVVTQIGAIIPNNQNKTYFTVDFAVCSSIETKVNCTFLPAELCGDSIAEKAEAAGVDKSVYRTAYCMPQDFRENNMMLLQGQTLNANFSYVNFSVRKCKNETLVGVRCASPAEIDSVLHNSYLIYTYSKYELDASKSGNPFTHLAQYSQFRVSSQFKLTTYNYYTKVRSISVNDFYYLNPSREIYESVEFQNERYEQMPNLPNDNVLVTGFFVLSNNLIVYQREHDNIIDILGKVGGLFSLLTSLIRIFLQPYQWLDLKQVIVNKLNDQEQQRQQGQLQDLTMSVVHYFKPSKRQKYLANLKDIESQIDILEILKKLRRSEQLSEIVKRQSQGLAISQANYKSMCLDDQIGVSMKIEVKDRDRDREMQPIIPQEPSIQIVSPPGKDSLKNRLKQKRVL